MVQRQSLKVKASSSPWKADEKMARKEDVGQNSLVNSHKLESGMMFKSADDQWHNRRRRQLNLEGNHVNIC